jgi:hypothetical protein
MAHASTTVADVIVPHGSAPYKQQRTGEKTSMVKRVAKGKLSPVQANKIKHKADAVLGKHDATYHNC